MNEPRLRIGNDPREVSAAAYGTLRDAIAEMLTRHDAVCMLFDHGWMTLNVIDDDRRTSATQEGGEWADRA